MPRKRKCQGIIKRVKTFLLGTETPDNIHPDLESTACQKCKILDNYMKMSEKALNIEMNASAKQGTGQEQATIYPQGFLRQ